MAPIFSSYYGGLLPSSLPEGDFVPNLTVRAVQPLEMRFELNYIYGTHK